MIPDLGFVSAVFSIVVIDLVLSGDNAVVIGTVAHRLPTRQRRIAIIVGGAGAIAARITFTAAAALLLTIPMLRIVGGVILLGIAFNLLQSEVQEFEGVHSSVHLGEAIRTIVLADVVMSLDNILAVGAVASGDIWLLLFGLGLSMPILLFGSEIVATVINRLPVLVYLGTGILAWTAATMIVHDDYARLALGDSWAVSFGLQILLTAGTLIAAHLFHRTLPNRRRIHQER